MLVLQIEVFITFVLEVLAAVATMIFNIVALLSPYFFMFLIFIIVYWMAYVGFPYTMRLVVYFGIPFVNMLILAITVIIKIAAMIYMILGTIWNAVVPFLGILLMFIFDIIFTLLDAVNQILGAIDLGTFFADLMPLLNMMMEIVIQIIQVIIQVGEPILDIIIQIIVPLLQVIFSIIRVLIPVVTFLLRVIFFVLKPIIWLLQAFFGGGQASSYGEEGTSAARKLLSIGGLNQKTGHAYSGYDPYAMMIMSTLNMQPADFYTQIHGNSTPVHASDLNEVPQMTGRKPLEYQTRKAGLRFMDMDDDTADGYEDDEDMDAPNRRINLPSMGAPKTASSLPSSSNDVADHFVHTFYKSSRTIPKETMMEATSIFDEVMDHFNNKDPLTISAIYASYIAEHGHLQYSHAERLGSVKYAAAMEHPNAMNARLLEERNNKRAELTAAHEAGRKILGMTVFPDDANAHLNQYMSTLEREHAVMIMNQAKAYKDKHATRMQLAGTVMGSVSVTMRKHAETTFHPDNIVGQWNALMQSMGYKDVWEWRNRVAAEYTSAEEYVSSFGQYFKNPLFDWIKKVNGDYEREMEFSGWRNEQEKMNSGRKLFGVDEDNNMGSVSDSRAAQSGFPAVSKRNCYTDPKHMLCVPMLPNSIFQFEIPLIELTPNQTAALLQNTSVCSPWINNNYCLFCWARFYNALVEIVFLVSAIPPLNYSIAMVTRLAPWTGVFLNWIFIVPKFKRASTLQWLCFVRETFSLFMTALILGVAFWLIWPFFRIFVRSVKDLLRIEARKTDKSEDVEYLDNYFRYRVQHPPPITPPMTTPSLDSMIIAGRIGGDHHIHHHYNYGVSQNVGALISFLNKGDSMDESSYHRLLAYFDKYHLQLMSRSIESIDADAAEQERKSLSPKSHPLLLDHKKSSTSSSENKKKNKKIFFFDF